MAKVSLLPVQQTGMHPDGDRNPGTKFDLGTVKDVRVNRSAVERRAATMSTRRTVKKEHQAAWLIHAVKTIDLTTLAGDDTPGTVRRLCAKARQPIREELLRDVGYSDKLATGAVCVYHHFVATAVDVYQVLATTTVAQVAHALSAAAPPSTLPHLQEAVWRGASMGWGDVYLAALLGTVVAGLSLPRRLAVAVVVVLAGLANGFEFLSLNLIPATVPVAIGVLVAARLGALRDGVSSHPAAG